MWVRAGRDPASSSRIVSGMFGASSSIARGESGNVWAGFRISGLSFSTRGGFQVSGLSCTVSFDLRSPRGFHIYYHYGIRSQKTIPIILIMAVGADFHNSSVYGPSWSMSFWA